MALQAIKGTFLKLVLALLIPKFPSIFSLTDIDDIIHSAIVFKKYSYKSIQFKIT